MVDVFCRHGCGFFTCKYHYCYNQNCYNQIKNPPGRIQAGRSNTNVGDTMRVKDMTKIEKKLYLCSRTVFVFSLMWLFPGSVEKRGLDFFSKQRAILGRILRFLILAGIIYHPNKENALNRVSVKIKDWPMEFR